MADNKSRKQGRDRVRCAAYKSSYRREHNKAWNLIRLIQKNWRQHGFEEGDRRTRSAKGALQRLQQKFGAKIGQQCQGGKAFLSAGYSWPSPV